MIIKSLNKYQWAAMGVMVMVIILLSQCNGELRSKLHACLDNCNGVEKVVRDTIQLPAPAPDTILIPVPQPYAVRYTDTLTVNDTLYVFKEFFAWRYYSDTLWNDTTALIVVNDTLTENKIASRSLVFHNRLPRLIKETTFKEKPLKFRLFGGGFVGGNTNNFEAGLSISAVPKNDRFMVGYHYDLIVKGHRVVIVWKIDFTK